MVYNASVTGNHGATNGWIAGLSFLVRWPTYSSRAAYVTHSMLEVDASARAWFELSGRAIY